MSEVKTRKMCVNAGCSTHGIEITTNLTTCVSCSGELRLVSIISGGNVSDLLGGMFK